MYRIMTNTPNTKKSSVLWGYAPEEERLGLFDKQDLPVDFLVAPYIEDCFKSAKLMFRKALISSEEKVPYELRNIDNRSWHLEVKRLGYLDIYKLYEKVAYIEELHNWIKRHNLEKHFLKNVPISTAEPSLLTQMLRNNTAYHQATAVIPSQLQASSTSHIYKTLEDCITKTTSILRLYYARARAPFINKDMPLVAEQVSTSYANRLNHTFESYMEDLETLAWFKNRTYAYDKLEILLKYAQPRLFYALLEDIKENQSLYALRNYEYYEKMIKIKEIKPLSNHIVKKYLNDSDACKTGYKWTNMTDLLNLIKKDAENITDKFREHATTIYKDYIKDIDFCLDVIGCDLPKFSLTGSLHSYVSKIDLLPRVHSKRLKTPVFSKNDIHKH